MIRYKLVPMTDDEIESLDWKLKIESVFKDHVWSCGCTRYLPGQCECGDMRWITKINGDPLY